jgi:dienelactone hydrolase
MTRWRGNAKCRSRIAIGVVLAATGVSAQPGGVAGATQSLEGVAGPHEVGFRVETRLDLARPFRLELNPADDEHARPIRMFIWYPTEREGTEPAATYADYILADHGEPPGGSLSDEARKAVGARLRSPEFDGELLDAAVDRLLEVPVRARRDAAPLIGHFPLIVIGPGGTTSASLHALLAEHLASHGFISVAIPSLPRRAGERWPFDQTGVALHLRDLETALDQLLAWPPVDRSRVGLAAWSVGGVAQALMAMRNPDVDVLVSLDGATGYAYGLEMLRAAIDFNERGVSVPYLHAHGLAPARYEVEKDFTVFESLTAGPALLLTFPDLSHADFTSQGVLERWAVDPAASARLVEVYSILIEAVRRFLDASFDDPSGALEALEVWLGDSEVQSIVRGQSGL